MNTERINLLLDSYGAHFPEEGGVPERLQALWGAAETCAAALDLTAEDLPGMLRQALGEASSLLNYAGSVQPLNGLLCLAENEPEGLRQALTALLADDHGDLVLRQAQMQAFCDRCAPLLQLHAPGKRGWELNLRAAIVLTALIRPAENYLYKSTEARYLADMLGCQTDVSSGAHFTLSGYYAMCDILTEAIVCHPVLSVRIPTDGALAPEALRRLMVGDILLNAGAKKLALFGDAEPLIHTRSRAGQATQERAMQISRFQLELAELEKRLNAISTRLKELPAIDLIGQRFHSPVFGEVVAVDTQGSVLLVEGEGVKRRLSQPACFLQGHLMPQDEAVAAHYAQEREFREKQQEFEALIIDLQCQISRLQQKP